MLAAPPNANVSFVFAVVLPKEKLGAAVALDAGAAVAPNEKAAVGADAVVVEVAPNWKLGAGAVVVDCGVLDAVTVDPPNWKAGVVELVVVGAPPNAKALAVLATVVVAGEASVTSLTPDAPKVKVELADASVVTGGAAIPAPNENAAVLGFEAASGCAAGLTAGRPKLGTVGWLLPGSPSVVNGAANLVASGLLGPNENAGTAL